MNESTLHVLPKVTVFAFLMAFTGLAFGGGEPLTVFSSKDVKWSAAPAVLPKGAMIAVLSGDPAATGPIVLRLKMPAGYKIPAHWHPTDEHVTVLSGTFYIGMGDKLDPTQSHAFTAGGYAVAPAHMNHYAWTKAGATVQVNLMGPFSLTYVNPADDPSGTKAK
jgi:quercetin dioxygenase-like cupin family protein